MKKHNAHYRGDPIKNLQNFIESLDLKDDYESFISTPAVKRYQDPAKKAYKSNGDIRRIKCPNGITRKFQRRLNNRYFKKKVIWPPFVFGSIPKSDKESRDHIKCAEKHCKAKSLLKIDVSDFFDNVQEEHIKDILTKIYHFSEQVADFVCNVCCYEGTLVQGALTSSYVANMIFADVESKVVNRLSKKGLTYTRFIDDITISSKVSNYNFDYAKKLVEEMLLQKDLPTNPEKVEIAYSSIKPLLVHGLRVEFDQPRLPAKEVANLRAELHTLMKYAKEPHYRKTRSYRRAYDKCAGRIHKLSRVRHIKHMEFKSALEEIRPLPSSVDIKQCYLIIEKLELYGEKNKRKSWYKQRFNQAVYLNGIIKRLYSSEYKKIKEKLRKLEPSSRQYYES
ncbi:reverse transcriptase family protein [Pseudoalteromonas rubra]|uniref:reverse transcriptase family protein n=1 Tax=Pseudoalteromonas rubra TaxID=43658 RepID=UPI002DB92055|nr:reverse transcriptase family protein [Pseudoalteromonas rubra]MEC4089581.1 reverse transcriptase family protein [Pseudoalteromonas rubra]